MTRPMYALVCTPPDSLPDALRMDHTGDVDLYKARKQHERYCHELRKLGFSLLWLSPDAQYPDSVFVEDPAVALERTLVVSRLFRKERSGEEQRIEKVLRPFFASVRRIEPPGFLEGGDVVIAGKRLYIGLSKRTNAEGAEGLAKIAKDEYGYDSDFIPIPRFFLHLKGEVTYHQFLAGESGPILTVSEEIADHFRNAPCRVIQTPASERFGGNCISAGRRFLIHQGRTRTRRILEQAGFHVRELPMSEFEKIDGALTCLSKFFGS